MQEPAGNKLLPSERLNLFGSDHSPFGSNPEEQATNRLLEISDEDIAFDPLEFQKSQPVFQKHKNMLADRSPRAGRAGEGRSLVAQQPSKGHAFVRKPSARFISGEEVCVMKRERVLNLSNFLVLDSSEASPTDLGVRPDLQEDKGAFRIKPPKSLVAFIRKRNISHLKEQFQVNLQEKSGLQIKKTSRRICSPLQRVNMSCELKRSSDEQTDLLKTQTFKVERQIVSPDLRSTSPNFRNKRLTHYCRYRLAKQELK